MSTTNEERLCTIMKWGLALLVGFLAIRMALAIRDRDQSK